VTSFQETKGTVKILLTGARGFTGRHFAEAAKAQGHEVVVCHSNICDLEALTQEIGQLDFSHVVHLAAISFVGNEDERAFYDVNLFGALHLLQAVARRPEPPQRVLIASSANVYGNAPVSPIAETQDPAPTNHYATSKLAMEHMARTFEDRLPIVLARTFNSTGPGQSPSFLIPKLVGHYQARSSFIELGNLAIEREFNDIRMVCEAYLRLLEQGQPGEAYNICSGKPYQLNTVVETLGRLTSHHPELKVNPAFVRANEVIRLCGDPSKLHQAVGILPNYELEATLSWMLAS
jgi:GDP-6-deoxy-D-talose 4-dehydrogenase